MAEELNAFTKIAGADQLLPAESIAAQKGALFRELQLRSEPATVEELEALGLPTPESQTIPNSQASEGSATEIILANDTKALPEGSSGRILAEGVFEVTASSNTEQPDITPTEPAKVAKWGENPEEHSRRNAFVENVE